jgi:hypothetical protein
VTFHTTYSGATNRENGQGFDGNGNQTTQGSSVLSYDVDNRLGGRLIKDGDWRVVEDAKGSARWRKNVTTNAVESADSVLQAVPPKTLPEGCYRCVEVVR